MIAVGRAVRQTGRPVGSESCGGEVVNRPEWHPTLRGCAHDRDMRSGRAGGQQASGFLYDVQPKRHVQENHPRYVTCRFDDSLGARARHSRAYARGRELSNPQLPNTLVSGRDEHLRC